MTAHDIARIQSGEHRVTVTCTCGREFEHPNQAGAEYQHQQHQYIEAARDALPGGN